MTGAGRMKPVVLLAVATLLCGCRDVPVPRDPAVMARNQAELVQDPDQRRLWEQVAMSGGARGTETLVLPKNSVRRATPATIPDRSAPPVRHPFPTTLDTAVVLRTAPEIDQPFRGTARIAAVDSEFIALDLPTGLRVELQAKIEGNPLRARVGTDAEVFYRMGVPTRRNDVLALTLPEENLVYALVGDDRPVRIDVPGYALTAWQTGDPDRSPMDVTISVGGETRTLRVGEQAEFGQAALTVMATCSVATSGAAADNAPGRSHRLAILAWRTRPR